ncbi:MAG: PQQ-binding-like beta-propeller repeat protein, partial [Planctomycetes bacterium]|nr:PQQ-binding-like beta-propeller repeat protein [Planctomycetota bacterium]
ENRYLAAEALRTEYEAEERRNSQQNAENLHKDALASLQASDLITGLRLLKKAASAARDRAWVEENEIEKMVESLESYFEEARGLREEATRLREAGKFDEAHKMLVRLVSRYGNTDEAREARLPVLIKSNPSGARIFVNNHEAYTENGDRKAVTPAVLDLVPGAPIEIEVCKEGFMQEKRMVDLLKDQELSFELRFKTEQEYCIGPKIAFTPTECTGGFVLGYRDGRIKRYDLATRDFLWSYAVKDLKNLDTPLSVTEDKVYFCWGTGMVGALSTKTGELVWERRLPSASHLLPLESCGVVFVPMDNGRVILLNPQYGKTLLDKDLKSNPVLDPLPWKNGAILPLEDGRIVWIESQKGRIVHHRRLLAQPTSACLSGDQLLIGNQHGGIDCFGCESAEVFFSHYFPLEEPITQLKARGDRVFGVQNNRHLYSLDTSRLEITGKFLVVASHLWLSNPGNDASIAVAGSDSIMYLLRSSDLSLIRKYRADGEIALPGLQIDDHVYFYSEDGILNGLRY